MRNFLLTFSKEFCIALLCLVCAGTGAQNKNCIVKGVVIDSESKKPIEGVFVQLSNPDIGKVEYNTAKDGSFSFPAEKGEYRVLFYFSGYCSKAFMEDIQKDTLSLGVVEMITKEAYRRDNPRKPRN